LPSLFETRRRLPTSATTYSTCGQPNPGSFVSHRDEGLDLLPFLSPHALSLAEAVKSGELRFVRSNQPQCWFFRVAPVCPTVMLVRSPHQPTLACWLHSEDLRAQVEGLSEGRVLLASNVVLAPSACALWRMRDGVPLLSCLRTSAVIGAFARLGGTHSSRRTDLGPRSDNAPRSALPSRKPGCLSPLRHAKDLFGYAKGLLPPAFAPALSLTPPTLSSRLGSVFLIGHCKFTVQSPAGP
jgi:hypothetical protein